MKVLAGLALLTLIGGGYLLYTQKTADQSMATDDGNNDQFTTLLTRSNTEGAVTVDVTPSFNAQSNVWRFDVTMNTHSVPLDMDMVSAAMLTDQTGTVYLPRSWEGDPPGGHHRKGVLMFEDGDMTSETVVLALTGIALTTDRVFEWKTAEDTVRGTEPITN